MREQLLDLAFELKGENRKEEYAGYDKRARSNNLNKCKLKTSEEKQAQEQAIIYYESLFEACLDYVPKSA
jgi:hypothetical protein